MPGARSRAATKCISLVPGLAKQTPTEQAIGFLAVLLGAGNAAGGYVVTERMLEMFKSSKKPEAGA